MEGKCNGLIGFYDNDDDDDDEDQCAVVWQRRDIVNCSPKDAGSPSYSANYSAGSPIAFITIQENPARNPKSRLFSGIMYCLQPPTMYYPPSPVTYFFHNMVPSKMPLCT